MTLIIDEYIHLCGIYMYTITNRFHYAGQTGMKQLWHVKHQGHIHITKENSSTYVKEKFIIVSMSNNSCVWPGGCKVATEF